MKKCKEKINNLRCFVYINEFTSYKSYNNYTYISINYFKVIKFFRTVYKCGVFFNYEVTLIVEKKKFND